MADAKEFVKQTISGDTEKAKKQLTDLLNTKRDTMLNDAKDFVKQNLFTNK